jgi:hypothetical protein
MKVRRAVADGTVVPLLIVLPISERTPENVRLTLRVTSDRTARTETRDGHHV